MVSIRQITIEDAKEYLDLRNKVDAESEFMLYDPGERFVSYEQQRNTIQNVLFRNNQMIFVTEDEGKLIGYLEAQGGTVNKVKHKALIVLGLLKEYRNQGIGTKLFEEVEQWAKLKGLHKLELLFMDGNQIGRHLYTKMGFIEEGRLKDAYLMKDGSFMDEIRMGKILS